MSNSKGLKKATYFTFLDRCSQDSFTTACVIENDFIQVKKIFQMSRKFTVAMIMHHVMLVPQL